MKNIIQALRKKEDNRGFTIVEILVAMAIFIIALGGVASTVSAGLTQIKDSQVQRAAAECARIAMEFMSTVPTDIIYKESQSDGGNPIVGTFAAGGLPALNAFASGAATSACRDLSSNTSVGLRYSICPGCVAMTTIDAATLIEYTTCYYTIKGTVYYNGLIYKKTDSVVYDKKFYGKMTDKCENICGKGGAPAPGQWAMSINECNSL